MFITMFLNQFCRLLLFKFARESIQILLTAVFAQVDFPCLYKPSLHCVHIFTSDRHLKHRPRHTLFIMFFAYTGNRHNNRILKSFPVVVTPLWSKVFLADLFSCRQEQGSTTFMCVCVCVLLS